MCPEGGPAIFGCTILALVFAFLDWEIMALVALAGLFFSLNFFRDPERIPPAASGLATAPADGKVVRIANEADPFSGERRSVVCVFMNVFDVHVNRVPCSGNVRQFEYIPGKFINASRDKASKDNERCATLIEDESGDEWSVVQIAGLVARRIVVWAETNDFLYKGERLGMIKFGSRVDLYLPPGYTPQINIGDRTLAGQTIIAKRQG